MSEDDRESLHIARLLNSARQIGIEDGGLLDVITDYFTGTEPESDQDDLDSESEDEVLDLGEVPVNYMNDLDEQLHDVSLDDDEEADLVNGDDQDEQSAVTKAMDKLEFVNMNERKNHCACKLFNGDPCILQFTEVEKEEIRLNVCELTSFEKDLMILGMICGSINDSAMTAKSRKPAEKQNERKETRLRWFYIGSKRICRDTFIYLMETSKRTLTTLKQHYQEFGLIPRKKKSGGRRERTALKLEDIRQMVRFVLNFTEEHAIILPGRVPGFMRDDIKIIPSQFSKAELWRRYRDSAAPNQRIMGISSFRNLWKQLLPYVVIAKPATDLCWTCQKNNSLIIKNINVDETEKTETLKIQEQHLLDATTERSFYREMCQSAKAVSVELGISILKKSIPCSQRCAFHYSFDFAQQVHYPADPMQPGPIYFKVPRKCQLFGINCEGLTSQINYLIDEAASCGKGANTVISLFHHFLENYGIGETNIQINADNCSGQNKNNCMLWYLCWRTLTNLHETVYLHFLLAGHTKFSPDWCFGLLKKTFRKTRVSSLAELCSVVTASTQRGINRYQLVGEQDGTILVPMYDWVTYLGQYFRRFPGIKSLHHFQFDHANPGVLVYKNMCDSEEGSFNLMKEQPPVHGMPEVIVPPGLDAKRKAYLYKEIREFCTFETMDLVCPKPATLIDSDSEEEVAAGEQVTAKPARGRGARGRGRGTRGRGRGHGPGK